MLQVNFIIIYIIHKISIFLKTTRVLKRFLRSNNQFLLQHKIMKILRVEEDNNIEENIIKDIKNLFRLKKTKIRKKTMPQLNV